MNTEAEVAPVVTSRRAPRPPVERCLNCDTALTGHFCAHCGQEAKDQTVAVRLLASDLLAEVASFDSKLLRTVGPLLFRPGLLTSAYNAGQRVRYLSPLKLYLTLSVIFFLALPYAPHRSVDVPPSLSRQTHAPSGPVGAKATPRVSLNGLTLPATVAAYEAQQRDPSNPHRDSPLKHALKRQLIKGATNPAGFKGALMGELSRMMFVLLPLFALLLKMLYRRRLYIEHIIFALHTHAFAFLVLTLILLIRVPWVEGLLGAALAAYLFLALRRVYGQSWPKTALKFSLLSASYLLLFPFAIVVTALMTLLFF